MVHELGFKNAYFKFGRVKEAGESWNPPPVYTVLILSSHVYTQMFLYFCRWKHCTQALKHKKMCLNYKIKISHGFLITISNPLGDIRSKIFTWRGGNIGRLHTHCPEHPEAHPWSILQRQKNTSSDNRIL